MISITPLAQEKLTGYLTENKLDPQVRVYLSSTGCGGGGQVSLALDPPDADDLTVVAGEVTLSMSKALYDQIGKVVVDFKDDGTDAGFVVDSEKPVPPHQPSSCGGCTCCG